MIVLTDISALECFRNYGSKLSLISLCEANTATHRFDYASKNSFASCKPSASEIAEILDWHSYLSRPVHLLVSKPENRSQCSSVVCHCLSGKLPSKSIVKLDDVCSVSPEMCFTKMANSLSPIETIKLGFEFCGCYSLINDSEDFLQRTPLTTPKRIQAFVDSASCRGGLAKAQKCLKYVIPMSASPMETNLAMLLFLPMKYGGYGLPRAKLNHEIRTSTSSGRTRSIVCDMMWPQKNLALEYDSNRWHEGIEKLSQDSARRTALNAQNIDVISVTWSQIVSTEKLDEVAIAVSKKLGWRLRGMTPTWRSKQIALKRALLAR